LYAGIIAKYMQKGGKYGHMKQVDVVGGLGPFGHTGQPHMGTARGAMWPCHVTDPWELLHKPSHALIQCQFEPKDRMEWPWIAGSTVIHMEASNLSQNLLNYDGPHVPVIVIMTSDSHTYIPHNLKGLLSFEQDPIIGALQYYNSLFKITSE
jgi:hypothetical protein